MTTIRFLDGRQRLVGVGLPDVEPALNEDALYRPQSYATAAVAFAALGIPANTPRVMWNPEWTHLEEAHAAMSADQILVLPERDEPYPIDTSNGFMAAGVKEIDGTGSNGRKNGSRVSVVSNPRLWFEMTRARRGIVGLGPGAVIEPSSSGWSAPPQVILQNEATGDQFMRAYFENGTTQNLVGAQNGLIGYEHPNPIFANFTLKGRSLGGVAYSGLKRSGGTGAVTTFKRVHFDKCWRSHAGVPNGETGGLTFNGGGYLVENCDLTTPTDSVSGGSCVMWNNTTGGAVRNVRADVTNLPSNLGGMWTFWRSGGVNTFENVHIHARQTGMNIEESRAGFELNWTGGEMTVNYPANRFHFAMNPTGGAPKITLTDVEISPNAYTPDALVLNVYSSPGIARRSLIACNNMPVSCVPSSNWIN